MSEEFEVKGPHEHVLEQLAEHAPKGMAGQLAVMTAVLATIGAMFSYMAGATQADAGLLKNDAAIKKTEAADQWAYYQAKANKQSLADLGAQLLADEGRRAALASQAQRYGREQDQIKEQAQILETESSRFDRQSEGKMHEHHRWAQATTLIQVAIAMAAMALLTKRRWLQGGVFVVSAFGLAVGLMAYLKV